MVVDVKALQDRIWQRKVASDECYEIFKGLDIVYGPGHRGIESVYVNDGTALAKLKLPSVLIGNENDYILHPSIMDSAFQAVIVMMSSSESSGTMLPFALDEVEILGICGTSMWAFIKYKEEGKTNKFDIELFDDNGNVHVRFKGLSARCSGSKK